MASLKRSQTERSVGGSIPATDEFYTRRLRLPNGGAPPPRSESTHLTGTPGVPKMGVRARVADWPPRKDGGSGGSGGGGGNGGGVWHITVETDSPSTTTGSAQSNLSSKLGHLISPQDSSMLRNIHNTLKNKMHSKGKDNRFLSPDGYLGSPRKGMRRIRQRSNSDITISELDGDGSEGWSFSGWTPMHREYGSTSSIDKHGVSGESFFDMLKGYQTDAPDQRSPAPDKLSELLTVAHKQTALDLPDGPLGPARGSPASRLKEREKHMKRRSKSETGGESIFRKLRSVKAEGDSSRAGSDAEDGKSDDVGPPPKPWVCQKGFSHFDIQSILFDLNEAVQSRQSAVKRKNTTTGASAAAAASASTTSSLSSTQSGAYGSPCGSQEELNIKDGPSLDSGDDKSNDLVLSCPCFRNEIGGEGERNISPSKQGSIGSGASSSSRDEEGSPERAPNTHFSNAGVAVLEAPKDGKSLHHDRGKSNIVEHVDLGAYYYRKYFYLREHWNYLGVDETLGPVAVSIRREKLEDHKEHGQQYNYRVIFRTSGVSTHSQLPSTNFLRKSYNSLPLKEVLEYLVPELNAHCLRLALNTPKVTEQLMKLDEQGLSFQLKVGIMYCQASQSSEEEMYNNEAAGPALEEFLQLLGERVRLKGFSKYRAQLDTKTDSTGTHSLYTTFKDYEIMFHVSTMLPYTPNNKQQLLRKRHIGNDIVTIVFQEPGAKPFSPKNIRSHFQHVFVVVRAHNPCSENTCYSVAVARSRDVPAFGSPIPEDAMFPKSTVFRDFLLAKVINAENAAHKSDKFRAMATRTRQEYLRDLAERHVTSTPIDPSGKFPFISLAHKRKEKTRPYFNAELRSPGAITWPVYAEDHGAGGELEALLAISNDFLVLVDPEAKAVVFNCAVRDVIGWTLGSPASMKIYYERGESISLRSINNNTEDFREVIRRLEHLTKGCETSEMTLRRNGLGQLGFHVNYEGIVAEVEPYGYAWQAGLRQGSRLVEICKVAVATLSHEQMIDLLRTSVTVKVVIIPPHEDATPLSSVCVFFSVKYRLMSCFLMHSYLLCSVDAPVTKSSSSYSGGPRIQRQEQVIHLSPKKGSQSEGPYSHSSSNTLSSTASSGGHSDDKWYDMGSGGMGDQPDSEPNGLGGGYLQGASADSGIDATTYGPTQGSSSSLLAVGATGTRERAPSPWHSPTEGSRRVLERSPPAADSPVSTADVPPTTRGPPTHLLVRDGSSYSLSDMASYSNTRHSVSPAVLSSSHSSPREESSSATSPSSSSSQSSVSPGPKSFYPRQGATSKYLIGWRKPGSTINSVDFGDTRKRPQGEGTDPGSSQSRPSLRDLHSPQAMCKSTVEEGLKKLLSPESPPSKHDINHISLPFSSLQSSSGPASSGRRSLHRTLSDESIYRGQRLPSLGDSVLEQALASEVLFSCSTLPRSPTTRGAPLRRPSYKMGIKMHGDLSASDTSLADLHERQRPPPPELGLMPLPDTETDSGLDWTHLVDVANAFEGERRPQRSEPISLLFISPSQLCHSFAQSTCPSFEEGSFFLILLKVSQLEALVKMLQEDLKKEREEKLKLQAQIKRLWEDNQRLQEESQSSAAKLKKFTEWVFNTIDLN
uniref:Signal-induced proliferation-associated 1-like protein 1 n=1 Tax=Sinocyclocheilus grahami TaxID=75366 RepID=A0A672SC72_SINGR